MTLESFPTDAPEGLSVQATRNIFAGLVTKDRDGNPRPGIIGSSRAILVTGESSMRYTIAPFYAITSRTAGGIELLANETLLSVETLPAPSTNARIDTVYIRARFASLGDNESQPEIGVASGEVALSPHPALLPPGAIELARIRVPSGTTRTDTAVITQTFPHTSLEGTPVPFRNLASLHEWTTARENQHAYVAGHGDYEWDGKTWRPYRPLMQHAEFTATLAYVDGMIVYPKFVVDRATTTSDFLDVWHTGNPDRPGGLTFREPGVYAVNFVASHTVEMYARSMLTIDDLVTGKTLARSSAQPGETIWSVSHPNLRTRTGGKQISFGAYKHDGTAEPGTFHITIDKLF